MFTNRSLIEAIQHLEHARPRVYKSELDVVYTELWKGVSDWISAVWKTGKVGCVCVCVRVFLDAAHGNVYRCTPSLYTVCLLLSLLRRVCVCVCVYAALRYVVLCLFICCPARRPTLAPLRQLGGSCCGRGVPLPTSCASRTSSSHLTFGGVPAWPNKAPKQSGASPQRCDKTCCGMFVG